MALLASNIELEMKVAQLKQGVQSEEQLQFDCRLACSKAEIKLNIYHNYVTIYKTTTVRPIGLTLIQND